MQSYTWSLSLVEEGMQGSSILAGIASPFALLLVPLGFGAWQLAAAAITGFIAKENVVGTLAVVYSISNFIDPEEFELIAGANDVAAVMGLTSVAALSYLVFNLFTPPCFAAIGAMNGKQKMALGGSRLPAWNGIYRILLCLPDRYPDHHRKLWGSSLPWPDCCWSLLWDTDIPDETK